MSNNLRPVYEQPIYHIIIEVRDFSLDKAMRAALRALCCEIEVDANWHGCAFAALLYRRYIADGERRWIWIGLLPHPSLGFSPA